MFLSGFQFKKIGDIFPRAWFVKSWWRLPPSFVFVCSIDYYFVHLPKLLSDPALGVHVVSSYSAGEIGEASKVT